VYRAITPPFTGGEYTGENGREEKEK